MPPTLVQHAGNLGSTALTSTPSVAFGTNVTAGNVLVVFVASQGPSASGSIASCSDTIGNSYTAVWANGLLSIPGGSIVLLVGGFFCVSKASGANTVTASTNFGGQNNNGIGVGEVSGLVSPALDVSVSNAIASATTTMAPLTITNLRANEFLWGYTICNTGGATTPSFGAPYALADQSVASANGFVTFYAALASSGSNNLSGSWSSPSNNTVGSAAFSLMSNPSSGGGGALTGGGYEFRFRF